MDQIRPLPGVFYADFVGESQHAGATHVVPTAPRASLLEHLRADIREWKDKACAFSSPVCLSLILSPISPTCHTRICPIYIYPVYITGSPAMCYRLVFRFFYRVFFIRRQTPFSPYGAPRFPTMSEISSLFSFFYLFQERVGGHVTVVWSASVERPSALELSTGVELNSEIWGKGVCDIWENGGWRGGIQTEDKNWVKPRICDRTHVTLVFICSHMSHAPRLLLHITSDVCSLTC